MKAIPGVTSAEIIKGHSSDDAPLSCTEEKDAARQQRKEQKDVLKYSLYKLLTKLQERPFHGEILQGSGRQSLPWQ